MDRPRLILGDCLTALGELDASSVDAVVTDPPYGLSFMGKGWDCHVPSVAIWEQCLRVLKPGGHLLAFAGTRTQHRMAVRIEDAGFEIRDMIAWVYGSGFPKSLNVSKAIERQEVSAIERQEVSAIERQFCEWVKNESGLTPNDFGTDRFHECRIEIVNTATSENPRWGRRALIPTFAAWKSIRCRVKSTIPNWVENCIKSPPAPPIEHPGQWKKGKVEGTKGAGQWAGWGTALKPSLEPITVARKPLIGTVAENVLQHGTGAINVDGCRVGTEKVKTQGGDKFPSLYGTYKTCEESTHIGRWPANFIHDGSEEVTDLLGSAARFFYCAKASKRDRDEGCEGLEVKQSKVSDLKGNRYLDDVNCADGKYQAAKAPARNNHPTVKPTDLMRYLCRLVTPPGGTVLDPVMGSGSTGKAAILEGFRFIGVEREAEYFEIAKARIAAAGKSTVGENRNLPLFDGVSDG
jgi:DNA modification methylase